MMHTPPLLHNLKILKPQDLFELTSCRAVKKATVNDAPIRIREIFQLGTSTGRPQRFPNNMKVDYKNQGRIGYEIKKLWNDLPEDLKSSTTSIKKFTTEFKERTFEKYKSIICSDLNCYACSN